MARRRGERTARMNERDYPNIVEMLAADVMGKRLNEIHDWHAARGIEHHRGRGQRRDDRDYVRWCFADAERAQAFIERFGGEIAPAAKRRSPPPNSGL